LVGTTDVKFYKSQNGGLGGAISATQILSTTPNNFFQNVPRNEQATGDDYYLCAYVKNTHATEDMKNFNFWLGSDTLQGDTTIKWGFDSSNLGNAVNGYRWSPNFVSTGSNKDETAHSAEQTLTTFTCCAWFKLPSPPTPDEGWLVNKGGTGSDTAGENNNYGLWLTNLGEVRGGFEESNGADHYVTSSLNTYCTGSWHFALVYYDGTAVKLFVDDMVVPVGTHNTTTTPEQSIKPIRINQNSRAVDGFTPNGSLIDEVRVWSRALTDIDERVALYQNNIANPTGLILEKSFGSNDFNLLAQTIPDIYTQPVSVTWIPAGFEPNPVNVGDLKAGKAFPIWIWYHVDPEALARKDDATTFNFSFDIPSGGTGSTGGGGTGGTGGGTGGTAPPPTADYKIAFIGDEGCAAATDHVIALIKNEHYDYVFSVGDHAYASSSCWTDRFTSLKPNFDGAYGNHEYSESGGISPYKTFFTHDKTYFTRKFRNILFIIVDTNINCDPGSAQHSFVKNALETSQSDSTIVWRIVIMHHPWFGGSSSHTYDEFNQVEAFHALFVTNKVQFVITGHNHNWQRTHQVAFKSSNPQSPTIVASTSPYAASIAGLIHVVTGTSGHDSGGSLYSLGSAPSFNAFQNRTHNGLWEIQASNNGNTLTCSFVEEGGDRFDTFAIGKSAEGSGEIGTSTVDQFGVTMLNPTKAGARTWFNKWGNGIARSWQSGGTSIRNADPQDSESDLHCQENNSASVDGSGVFTMTGDAPRLYVNDPSRIKSWQNVEMTVYYMPVEDLAGSIHVDCRIAGRSNHQDEYQCAASGHGYAFEIKGDGTRQLRKELIHPSYADNQVSGTSGSPNLVWTGMKVVIKNINSGADVSVTGYVDSTDGQNGGTWVQQIQKIDAGNWLMSDPTEQSTFDSASNGTGVCTKPASRTVRLLEAAVSCYLRCDNTTVKFKKFSIREINPS
jgi:predicted phosphodiesterase